MTDFEKSLLLIFLKSQLQIELVREKEMNNQFNYGVLTHFKNVQNLVVEEIRRHIKILES